MYRENAKPDADSVALEANDRRFDARSRIIVTAALFDAEAQHELDVTPERLLRSALWDAEVLAVLGERAASARLELLEEMVAGWHVGEALERPCPRTSEVIARADRRARDAHRVLLSRGDLFFGLATTAGPAGRLVRTMNLALDVFDVDTPDVVPVPHPSPERAEQLTVHLVSDESVKLKPAAKLLHEWFGLDDADAAWRIVTCEILGRAPIGKYPGAEAVERVARARREGERRQLPLRYVLA